MSRITRYVVGLCPSRSCYSLALFLYDMTDQTDLGGLLGIGAQALSELCRDHLEYISAESYDCYWRWWLCSGSDPSVCPWLYIHRERETWQEKWQLTFIFNRSFLKRPGQPNIPIQAIGLSLYEDMGRGDPEEVPGTKVTRTQWLDLSSLEMNNLIGKNILIVDEVDDTRTTLEYAVRELQKDVLAAQKQLGREGEKTNFFVFVLHVRGPCEGWQYHMGDE